MENVSQPIENLSKPIENLNKKPAKSILKAPALNRQNSQDKDIKWDETNILQTLHPPDKDYGHMKIEEPKTPYSYLNEDEDGDHNSDNEMPLEIDPEDLAKLIDKKTKKCPKSRFDFEDMEQDSDLSDFEEIENETEEEREKRKEFEQKRKKHYNEYQMVKLARKLMKDEIEEDIDEDGEEN